MIQSAPEKGGNFLFSVINLPVWTSGYLQMAHHLVFFCLLRVRPQTQLEADGAAEFLFHGLQSYNAEVNLQ